jgi:uncharacterized protein
VLQLENPKSKIQNMKNECLIVFTRYPEPGKAKTRLIPVLGAIGAANLQCQMTEHTIKQVRELQICRPLAVEVYFAGNDKHLMINWLGSGLIYHQQGEGDLGSRMAQAFENAFSSGMDAVTIIGTDCPDLDAEMIVQAFKMLEQHDLVLGPANDGGYYLIGLRRFIPQLFEGIRWGTSEVWQQTIAIAGKMNVAIASLSPLDDIDRPEDLEVLASDLWIVD